MSESALAHIIGDSPAITALRALVARVAPLDLPVLIRGPTGAGKELVAQALHAESGRRGRCVAVNVPAIPEALFEATLFGHTRGAFTGANADARGYLAEADRGTVFLDEIGALPFPLQAKLLRVIETREFRPIGAARDRFSDFRTVAATNEPLESMVVEGRFRRDLVHRLGGIIIDVPPLRERLDDIPALASHFIRMRSAAGANGRARLAPGAIRTLQDHDWPGNVRELRLTIERAIALCERSVLHREDIERALGAGTRNDRPVPAGPEAFARRRLLDVLEQCAWDTARAAARLGVHRGTVYRRMRRLGITTRATSTDGPQPRSSNGSDRSRSSGA